MHKRYFVSLVILLVFHCSFAQSAFFSEDFGGGFPAGWSVIKRLGNNLPSAFWIRTTFGPQGQFATDPLNSTSADNGWMIFDSDLNCNAPQGQDSWLISPAIDASDKEAVWLAFETFYQTFNDRPAIRIGSNLNNLNTWASVEVFPGIIANQYGGIIEGDEDLNPQVILLNLSEYMAGEEATHFAFQFLSTNATNNGGGNLIGCAYNWQIDDVRLTDYDPRPENDMQVNAFFAIAPNAVTPYTQVEPIGFLADIRNAGRLTQAESTLKITIEDSDGVLVYQDSMLYGSIAPDSIAQNVFFATEFSPPPVANIYTATYSVHTEAEDEVPANNSRSFVFEISDTLFAKERGAEQVLTASDDVNFTFGNVFYVPNGSNLYARHLSFAVANANELSGKTVNTYLYRWYGNANDDFLATPDEYGEAPVAFNAYTFTGDEGNNLITVPVDLDGNGIALESGVYYIAAVEYQTSDNQELMMLVSTEFDYRAGFFYTDSLMRPRYAAVIDVGNTGDLDWTGFGLDLVPVVRLSISAPTSTAEQILPIGAARLHPNPAKGLATLALDLPQQTREVLLQLYDSNGKAIWQQSHTNVQQASIPLGLQTLASGIYWLRVRADSGIATLKLAVLR